MVLPVVQKPRWTEDLGSDMGFIFSEESESSVGVSMWDSTTGSNCNVLSAPMSWFYWYPVPQVTSHCIAKSMKYITLGVFQIADMPVTMLVS